MITVKLDPTQLKNTTQFLLAFPKEINLAKTRTLRKTVKWSGTQLTRKLSTENNMPQSVFKRSAKSNKNGFRVRTNIIKNGATFGQVWTGFKAVKAGYIGKPAQKKTGAAAGRRRFYKGAFVATMKSGHVGIFRRKGKSRTPVTEVTETINTVSVDDIEKQIPGQLYKSMDQELNYILNVAKQKKR